MRGYNFTLPGYYDYTYRGTSTRIFGGARKREVLSRSDVVKNPVISSRGWRNPSAYQMDYMVQEGPYGYVIGNRYNDRSEGWLEPLSSGSFVPVGYEAPVNGYGLESGAIIDALGKLKDQKVNLAVAMAEMAQTADLIASNATRIADAFRLAKRGKWKRAFSKLRHQPGKGWDKELSSRVLEFNYGVRPLISDVYGAMEAQEKSERKWHLIMVKGQAKDGDKGRQWKVEDRFISTLHRDIYYSEFLQTKCALYYYPKNDFVKRMSEVGMVNPLLVIWEKVPFSFAIDWFMPVGAWLDSMDAAIGLEFLSGTITEWSECTSRYRGCKSSAGFSSITGFRTCKRMRRKVLTNSPIAGTPIIKNPVSPQHALNAISLLGALR